MELKDKKILVANLITTANSLDEIGNTEEAERLTRLAEAKVEEIKEDQDLEDSDGPVDNTDPMAKGFGKSLCSLLAKVKKIEKSSNLMKKLEAIKEAKGSKADLRKIRNAIEELGEALASLCE